MTEFEEGYVSGLMDLRQNLFELGLPENVETQLLYEIDKRITPLTKRENGTVVIPLKTSPRKKMKPRESIWDTWDKTTKDTHKTKDKSEDKK